MDSVEDARSREIEVSDLFRSGSFSFFFLPKNPRKPLDFDGLDLSDFLLSEWADFDRLDLADFLLSE